MKTKVTFELGSVTIQEVKIDSLKMSMEVEASEAVMNTLMPYYEKMVTLLYSELSKMN